MTIHEDAAQELLDDYLADPEAAAWLVAGARRLRASRYDERYVAWIGQTRNAPQYWPMHQVAAFLAVHQALGSGEYAKVQIRVGETPGPDADRAGNAAKLRSLHRRFQAHLDMTQNGGDQDGTLTWDDTIVLERSTGAFLIDRGETVPVIAPYGMGSASAPLEVGVTLPSRTLVHLMMDGMVARWAYGDTHICLLANVKKLNGFYGIKRYGADAMAGQNRLSTTAAWSR